MTHGRPARRALPPPAPGEREQQMAVKVILTFTSGSLKGRQCEFTGPARYVLGRSVDCDVLLPTTPEFMEVSRHHFMLDIDPPAVQVRDLRSRNGTFLNGRDIGLGPPCPRERRERRGRQGRAVPGPSLQVQ